MRGSEGGAFAVIGIVISTTQWFFTRGVTQTAEREECLARHLQQLAATEAPQRVTAVASLRSFLSGDDDGAATHAIGALTSLLAVETSFAVRSAISVALANMSGHRAKDRQTLALGHLVDISRGLVEEGKLQRWSELRRFDVTEQSSTRARAAGVGKAIAARLRKGARQSDLSGVWLSGANLSGLALNETDFSGSRADRNAFRAFDAEQRGL